MSYLDNYLRKKPQNYNKAAVAYLAALDEISSFSPVVAGSILQELRDERSHLKLIASENFSSLKVQLAMGNLLTDKYAEGFANHRFYAGCSNIDQIEESAQLELTKLFGCEHAYVQPHSGADANLVAFWAVLTQKVQNPHLERMQKKNLEELTNEEFEQLRQILMNQKILGMSLNSGGHLTHGFRQNITAKLMHAKTYDVNPETELIDYELIAKQAKEFKPLILLAGYSAYPRAIDFEIMRQIADEVGAVLMVDMAHFAGLVAGKVFTGKYNPVPYADIITSTTHKTLRGPRGGIILCKNEYKDAVNKGCPLVLGGPLPHVMAAKSIAFKEANEDSFKQYAKNIVANSQKMAEFFLQKGVRLVTGGTDNHLLVLDLSEYGINGRQAEILFRMAGITVNRNTIPFDKKGAWYTSGVRIGTPAVTTLGMGSNEMKEIVDIIYQLVTHAKPAIVESSGLPSKIKTTIDNTVLLRCQERVKEICGAFPLYPEIEID